MDGDVRGGDWSGCHLFARLWFSNLLLTVANQACRRIRENSAFGRLGESERLRVQLPKVEMTSTDSARSEQTIVRLEP